MRILAIAKNGFKEVIRDKILYVIGVFALLLIIASRILPQIAVSTDEKILLDLGIGAINVFGVIISIFVGTNLINKEIEKKTLLILIPKPITKTEFIIGKHLGLTAVIGVLISAMTIIYFGLMSFLKINYPFNSLLIAILFLLLGLTLLIAIAIMFSVLTSSILATLLTFGVYIMGNLSRDLLKLAEITENPAIQKLTKTLFLVLPDLQKFDLKNEAVYNILPSTGELISTVIYGFLYITILLTLTILIFSRRQF